MSFLGNGYLEAGINSINLALHHLKILSTMQGQAVFDCTNRGPHREGTIRSCCPHLEALAIFLRRLKEQGTSRRVAKSCIRPGDSGAAKAFRRAYPACSGFATNRQVFARKILRAKDFRSRVQDS